MKKSIIATAILFVVLLVGCSKNESDNNKVLEESQVRFEESECEGGDDEDPLPSLRGTVTDTATLDSLEGVCVKLLTTEDVFVAGIGTDSNGHYYFNQVDDGNYKLVFTKIGYITKIIPIVVSSSPQSVNAQLRQAP